MNVFILFAGGLCKAGINEKVNEIESVRAAS
jgi:hypothetical protein